MGKNFPVIELVELGLTISAECTMELFSDNGSLRFNKLVSNRWHSYAVYSLHASFD